MTVSLESQYANGEFGSCTASTSSLHQFLTQRSVVTQGSFRLIKIKNSTTTTKEMTKMKGKRRSGQPVLPENYMCVCVCARACVCVCGWVESLTAEVAIAVGSSRPWQLDILHHFPSRSRNSTSDSFPAWLCFRDGRSSILLCRCNLRMTKKCPGTMYSSQCKTQTC